MNYTSGVGYINSVPVIRYFFLEEKRWTDRRLVEWESDKASFFIFIVLNSKEALMISSTISTNFNSLSKESVMIMPTNIL